MRRSLEDRDTDSETAKEIFEEIENQEEGDKNQSCKVGG